MRNIPILLLTIGLVQGLHGQNITMPDSLAVINNRVKSVKVYHKQEHGEKYLNLYLVYDKKGRLVREGSGENTYYYAYGYDEKGRRVTFTQRSAKGEFIQKYTNEYDDNNAVKKTSLYSAIDTLHPTHIYFYNERGLKIREEGYVKEKLVHLYVMEYDQSGNPSYVYDSTASVVSVRRNEKLVEMRTYDPNHAFLRSYTYRYIDSYVAEITDSMSPSQVNRYVILYAQQFVREVTRNGTQLSDKEIQTFKNEYQYVLPREYYEEDYGLPSPELVNEHNLTRDKKGNITRDELTQKQGSFSQTYVYEYEYEFY